MKAFSFGLLFGLGCDAPEPGEETHDTAPPVDTGEDTGTDDTKTGDSSATTDTHDSDEGRDDTGTPVPPHPCTDRSQTWLFIPTADAAVAKVDGLWSYVDAPTNPECVVPTVLVMTPYDASIAADIHMGDPEQPLFASLDYAFVFTDWRGTFGSAGSAYWGSPTHGEDGVDVIDWIARQPWSNGLVGTYGASALAEIQYEIAELPDPKQGRLAAAVPVFHELTYRYEHAYPGGVFREDYADLLDLVGWDFLAGLYKQHPTYDWTWKWAESTTIRDPADIDVPMLLVKGWFDSDDMARSFLTLRSESDPAVRLDHRILLGPWTHFATSTETAAAAVLTTEELAFLDDTHEIQKAALQFFDRHLRGLDVDVGDGALYQYIPYGASAWSSTDVWPPATSVSITYALTADGGLSTILPTEISTVSLTADPSAPSPSLGGMLMNFDVAWWCASGSSWSAWCDPTEVGTLGYFHGPTDQAPLFDWADHGLGDPRLFQTEALEEVLAIEGDVRLEVTVSTDQVDCDVTARIVDVAPDGTMMLVMNAVARLRYRGGFEAADVAWAEPGEVYALTLYGDTPMAWTLEVGHRLGVIVDGSNYPLYALNAHDGSDFIEDSAAPLVADIGIQVGGAAGARLIVEGRTP